MLQIYVLDKDGFIEGADYCESLNKGEEATVISYIKNGERAVATIDGDLLRALLNNPNEKEVSK